MVTSGLPRQAAPGRARKPSTEATVEEAVQGSGFSLGECGLGGGGGGEEGRDRFGGFSGRRKSLNHEDRVESSGTEEQVRRKNHGLAGQ